MLITFAAARINPRVCVCARDLIGYGEKKCDAPPARLDSHESAAGCSAVCAVQLGREGAPAIRTMAANRLPRQKAVRSHRDTALMQFHSSSSHRASRRLVCVRVVLFHGKIAACATATPAIAR